MKIRKRSVLIMTACLSLILTTMLPAQEVASLKGVETAKAIFDVRNSNPQKTARILNLIQQTFKDLQAAGKNPSFKIVFSGPSVKLVSSNRAGFSEEDQKPLDAIVGTLSGLSKDGIRMEICRVAMKSAEVDPTTVPSEITPVDNGWISSIGYQLQGYALLPLY